MTTTESFLKKGDKVKCFSLPIKKKKFEEASQGFVSTNTVYGTQFKLGPSGRLNETPRSAVLQMLFLWISSKATTQQQSLNICSCLCSRPESFMNNAIHRSATIYALLCEMQGVIQTNKAPINFFDKGDQCFRELLISSGSSELLIPYS